MDPERKIKDHMIEEFAQDENNVFCGIYLTIWHGRIRDALKENLDFPWFNCWILRCLLLEKSHFLQAQHPIVKYQLTHLVSNDSNDMHCYFQGVDLTPKKEFKKKVQNDSIFGVKFTSY